ncbi:aminotransferase class V-fold PLP-dependent enzyme [Porifericola rhodea]|uniref:pyridoxal phosphate-dependent decarboxylase family protein n=1 Tax=Porifericola rhodea TaxID=930972 RepID=UPI0026656D95|nr:aminotransferase class V-fold PLP-dependent enzyme [Porifericola rhodea]WKN30799.1 aminotransferase class V-fold PLP-dependent enzyme [Porifericola rhodea]
MGYQVVDLIVKHIHNLPNSSVGKEESAAKLGQSIDSSLPIDGEDPKKVLSQVVEQVLSNIVHLDHPRQFAWVPGPNNYVSVLADFIASGYNVFSGLWVAGSGAAQIEITTINWLIEILGMTSQAGGLFVSGGSAANLTGLTIARDQVSSKNLKKAVIYFTEQTHSSNEKALHVLNIESTQIRKVACNAVFEMDVTDLITQIEIDQRNGLIPFCVIANAGTTNTGAIDPMVEIREVCNQYNLWMHVDGAYGAAAVLSQEGKLALNGISLADSITLDPHKWLFQPYEMGCLLVKDKRYLSITFTKEASYLQDAQNDEKTELNFSNKGIQLTRNFRALKLWMSLKVFGLGAFSEAIAHSFSLVSLAEKLLSELPNWLIVTRPSLGILTFRFQPQECSVEEADKLNMAIVSELMKSTYAMLSSTRLQGLFVLRMCIINPRTTISDVENTIHTMNDIAIELEKREEISY